ncbi:MAG: chemotaxis protein CheX [Deltaproteobacteria bacterium]|jgi:CheY-specific phosphatase CheX|nr:chemotaxis protein CheX [Deltaproteobacteria bacterium]
MFDKCSHSLSVHAAAVFATMTGHSPEVIVTRLADNTVPEPNFTLGERVDFLGEKTDGGKIEGYFICGFQTRSAADNFAKDIAKYLGLSPTEGVDETDSYVGEFLNVVIGLTCSAWADHGFRVEFNPPKILEEHVLDTTSKDGAYYHLLISADNYYQTSIFLHFFVEN